ncbi:MAG: MFS transporter [Roseburia sp.]|nr:MFS transporter [Roseburia sp.]
MNIKSENKLKRNIILDYISVFITNLNMQSSVWVLYLAYCGMSLAQIGIIEGIYHATSILCEIPSGAAADLLGRKRSMLLSRLCIAVSCMLMLFSKSFGLFALSFAIQAVGNNFNSGSEEALVYDSMKVLGQEEHYKSVCGRLNVVVEVSQGIATVAGGILAEYSWVWCYGACWVIAALAVLPVWLMEEAPCIDMEREPLTVRELVARHFRTSLAILKSDSRILKVIVYYEVVFATETLLFFYSQQYYSELGYNKIQISLILLVVGGVSCLGALTSARLSRHFGRRLAWIAAGGIAVTLLCYGFENIVVSVAAFAVSGFFNSVLYPVHSDLLNSLIPSEQRATLISVDSMFFSTAMILLFPMAGLLADRWGLTAIFVGSGLALLLFVLLWNRRAPREKNS